MDILQCNNIIDDFIRNIDEKKVNTMENKKNFIFNVNTLLDSKEVKYDEDFNTVLVNTEPAEVLFNGVIIPRSIIQYVDPNGVIDSHNDKIELLAIMNNCEIRRVTVSSYELVCFVSGQSA